MYLTYDEFENMGGSMSEDAFPRFELKARRRIDAVTFGRLQNETPVREAVRYCMFDLIQAMHEDEANAGFSGRDITAMSNDGVSVSYASGAQSGSGSRYGNIVRAWLTGETDAYGVSLIYAGVSVK